MNWSLADAAFALDSFAPKPWSVRQSLEVGTNPPLAAPVISMRNVLGRFSPPGAALRQFSANPTNLWKHLSTSQIVGEISDRLRDPFIIRQRSTGLCGPIAIVAAFVRREPVRYIGAALQLISTGKLVCSTGRVIEAEQELRDEPLVTQIAQVDWLFAATMRDDENIWEDVDDNANGLESMTFWGEERGWIIDVLQLAGGGWETCFSWGETSCIKKAQHAVDAGGVAFFLIDQNLLANGGTDDEENASWAVAPHPPRSSGATFGNKVHSKNDDYPPDHWVEYLGGLSLPDDPDDDDPIAFRVWCWGSEYLISTTVGSFSEYLYAVSFGYQ